MTLSLPTDPRPDLRYAPILEIGASTLLSFGLRLGGASITPTSGTVKVYSGPIQSGGALVSTTALVPGSPSTVTVPSTPSTTPEDGYEVQVDYVYQARSYSFRSRAFTVGQIPVFLLDDEDLYREVSELRRRERLPGGQQNWNPQIEEGAYAVLQHLTSAGRKPWLTIDPMDLRSWHLAESLARVCAQIIGDEAGFFSREAARWRNAAMHASEVCRVTYYPATEIHEGQGVHRCGSPNRPRFA
jgi:hypothetical protein